MDVDLVHTGKTGDVHGAASGDQGFSQGEVGKNAG